MGEKPWDWFLPIRATPGDGIRFEYNEKLVRKLRNKAKAVVRHQAVAEYAKRAEQQGAATTNNFNSNNNNDGRIVEEKEESTITV
jgi:hypothetical protein